MQKTNGQWYTDKNGNHYFVENGQSPKEGWEASKRRKMISKGKYNVSEDGENYKEVSKDDYDKYEADETEFDETVDDDFGFDEDESINSKAGTLQDGIEKPSNLEDYLKEEGIEAHNKYFDELESKSGDERDKLKTGDTAYYNGKKVIISTAGLKDNELGGIQIKARDEDGHVYELSSRQLDKQSDKDEENLNPNNPKYKGFDRSSITNAKLVDEGYEFTDADSGKKVKNSIIEYIPYGALQDGDNEKLYAIVKNYDGTDTPKTGAIVTHSLEDAKEQLERQTQLGIQGRDRYLKRGRYDEDYFNIIRDNREPGDDEKYKERYGWDFNKPFAEHDFMKDDPYEKWKAERNKNNRPPMTKEQRQAIRDQINKMVASLDDARSIDEAWDIEEGIKELEDMLNKYKGKK